MCRYKYYFPERRRSELARTIEKENSITKKGISIPTPTQLYFSEKNIRKDHLQIIIFYRRYFLPPETTDNVMSLTYWEIRRVTTLQLNKLWLLSISFKKDILLLLSQHAVVFLCFPVKFRVVSGINFKSLIADVSGKLWSASLCFMQLLSSRTAKNPRKDIQIWFQHQFQPTNPFLFIFSHPPL